MRHRTQEDIVRDDRGVQPKTTVERIVIPGIETLHERPADEIAQALTVALKSRSGIIKLEYNIGECIELTCIASQMR